MTCMIILNGNSMADIEMSPLPVHVTSHTQGGGYGESFSVDSPQGGSVLRLGMGSGISGLRVKATERQGGLKETHQLV